VARAFPIALDLRAGIAPKYPNAVDRCVAVRIEFVGDLPRSLLALSRTSLKRPRQGFDFTTHMRALCEDICRRLPEFSHIEMDQVTVAVCQTRKRVAHGMYASLTPMRFENGELVGAKRGRQYSFQRLYDEAGREQLYILSFYLPRFMEVDFLEKLSTVIHELWHINPEFDGDLRRHAGRCYAHSHSRDIYDAQMEQLAKRYLATSPPEHLTRFLHLTFGQLQQRHGIVFGLKVPRPRLLPVKA